MIRAVPPIRFSAVYQVIDPLRKEYAKGPLGHGVGLNDGDVEVIGTAALYEAFRRIGSKPVLLEPDMVATQDTLMLPRANLTILIAHIQSKLPWVKTGPRMRQRIPLNRPQQEDFNVYNKALDQWFDLEAQAYPVYLGAGDDGRLHWSIPDLIVRDNQTVRPPAELFRALGLSHSKPSNKPKGA